MPGDRDIRQIVDFLEQDQGSLRDRLRRAADVWFEVMQNRELWPLRLRGRADCIHERFSLWGSVGLAVEAMSDEEVRQVAADMVAFAHDAHVWTPEEEPAHLEPSNFFG